MPVKITKNQIKNFIIIAFVSGCIGILLSFVFSGIDYLKIGNDVGTYILEETDTSGKGLEVNGDGIYKMSKDGGKITFEFFKDIYIDKLQYQYITAENQDNPAYLTITQKNIYGDEEIETISDYFFSGVSRSVIDINNKVSKISFEITDLNSDLDIFEFAIDNSFKWNPLLAVFISSCVFLLLFIFWFRDEHVKCPAVLTLISILVLGSTILVLQAPYCTGWDEQIHFSNSYNLAVVPQDKGTPNAVSYLANNADWFNQHHICSSLEERADLIRVLNEKGAEYGQPVEEYHLQMSSVGYIFQAGFITIGRFLHLPFYLVWILGKFSNVLLYAIGMSISVSIVPIAKRLLMVVSLIPTMVFLSATYTYDITVIVFITIGICIWIREVILCDKIFSVKWRCLYFISMIIGCMPKAVYAPLLLCALLLPKEKFRSTKDRNRFMIITILCGGLLLSTFVIPTLLSSPNMKADSRGGDTSITRQLKYVLGDPLAYICVLWKNVSGRFIDDVL